VLVGVDKTREDRAATQVYFLGFRGTQGFDLVFRTHGKNKPFPDGDRLGDGPLLIHRPHARIAKNQISTWDHKRYSRVSVSEEMPGDLEMHHCIMRPDRSKILRAAADR